MEELAVTLGDQQLITGASMFLVAFTTHCDITQYHFQIAVSLGLLSFMTFNSIVMSAQRKLAQSPWKSSWRVAWIVLLNAALLTSNLVTFDSSFLQDDLWGLSTQCVWNNLGDYTDSARLQLGILIILLMLSMASTIASLYPCIQQWHVWTWIDKIPFFIFRLPLLLMKLVADIKLTEVHEVRSNVFTLTKHVADILQAIIMFLCFAIFILIFTVIEIVSSVNFEIYRNFVLFVVGTLSVFLLRAQAENNGMNGDEDKWGFGQILPLLLLALPFFESIELIFGRWHSID
jgi:hypothetical protein